MLTLKKNPMIKVKIATDGFNNRFNTEGKRNSELKDRSEEITQNKAQKDKTMENTKRSRIQ